MKKLLLVTVIALFTLISNAQNVEEGFKFMGIQLGVSKQNFDSQLKTRGFEVNGNVSIGKFLYEDCVVVTYSTYLSNIVHSVCVTFAGKATVMDYNRIVGIYNKKYGYQIANRVLDDNNEIDSYVTTYENKESKIMVVWCVHNNENLISVYYIDNKSEVKAEEEVDLMNNKQI